MTLSRDPANCHAPLQGCGPAGLFCAGQLAGPHPWYNLALQSMQPLLDPLEGAADVQAGVCNSTAFRGGACIKFSGECAGAAGRHLPDRWLLFFLIDGCAGATDLHWATGSSFFQELGSLLA